MCWSKYIDLLLTRSFTAGLLFSVRIGATVVDTAINHFRVMGTLFTTKCVAD